MKRFGYPRRKFLYKMAATIMVITVSVILALFVILYAYFETIGLKLVSNANLKYLSQVGYSANYMNESVKNFASSVYLSESHYNLLYGKDQNAQDVLAEMNYLNSLVEQSPFVQSLYIYNGITKKYYSTWNKMESGESDFFDRQIVDMMDKNNLPARFQPILRKIPVTDAPALESTSTISVISYVMYDYLPDAGESVKGAIIVNIKPGYLSDMMGAIQVQDAKTGSVNYIVNESGQIVVSDNSANYMMNSSDFPSLLKVRDHKAAKGYFLDRATDQTVLVTYFTSDILNWKFINIVPEQAVFQEVNRMMWSALWIGLGIVVVGVVLAMSAVKYLYTPIDRLVRNTINNSNYMKFTNGKGSKDEMHLLSSTLIDGLEKADLLERLQKSNPSMQRAEVLRDILLGKKDVEEKLREKLIKHVILLNPDQSYVLFLLHIDHYALYLQKNNERDQRLLKYAIGNAASEVIGKSFANHEFIDMGRDHMAVFLAIQSENYESETQLLMGAIQEIQKWVLGNFHISLTAAVSFFAKSLEEIRYCYEQALHVSKYRYVHGHGGLLSAESLNYILQEEFQQPTHLERQLEEQLALGLRDELLKTYGEIVYKITSYSYDTIISYTMYLCYLVSNKIRGLQTNGVYSFPVDIGNIIKSISACETMDEANEHFKSLFISISKVLSEKRRKNGVVDSVTRIIESNYMDKGLCQEHIANTLNISKNYLGKLFRDTYSKSISEYISDVRLNKAAELISTGTDATEAILESIGWENKNYFYRMFKNKFGVSLSEYKGTQESGTDVM